MLRSRKMKKTIVTIFIFLLAILAWTPGVLADSFSGTFQINVYIPAVVGINVPDPSRVTNSNQPPLSLTKADLTTSTQQLKRDGRTVTVQTTVVR